jgi:hypothetical protein
VRRSVARTILGNATAKIVFTVEADEDLVDEVKLAWAKGTQIVLQGEDWVPFDERPPVALAAKLRVRR